MCRVTFMIAQNVIDRCWTENFFKHIENSIHDSFVAILCSFPNPVIYDIASMINKLCVRVITSNASESIFNCTPWCVAVLFWKNKINYLWNQLDFLPYSLPRNQLCLQDCLELHQRVCNILDWYNFLIHLPCNFHRNANL